MQWQFVCTKDAYKWPAGGERAPGLIAFEARDSTEYERAVLLFNQRLKQRTRARIDATSLAAEERRDKLAEATKKRAEH